MPKFDIEIIRTSSVAKTFSVEADTEEQAIQKAREEAHNTEFDHSCCSFPEYEVSMVEPIEEEEE